MSMFILNWNKQNKNKSGILDIVWVSTEEYHFICSGCFIILQETKALSQMIEFEFKKCSWQIKFF